jgi:hypothetical protein
VRVHVQICHLRYDVVVWRKGIGDLFQETENTEVGKDVENQTRGKNPRVVQGHLRAADPGVVQRQPGIHI